MLKKESKNIRFIINRIVSTNNNLTSMSCLSRNFHALPSPLESRRKLRSSVNGFVRVNNGIGFALRLRGCSDPHKTFAIKQQLAREIDVRLGNELNGYGACQRGKPFVFNQVSRVESFVVAVDVDEVLGNFVSALNRFIADRYSMNHTVSEYHVYEFFKIWNCSRDEADIRVHEFFKTSYFKNGIHPIPGALEALNNLSKLCKLSVVTSRQNVIKDHTVEWIEKHYPGLFHEIHFGNHFALDGVSRAKSEICRALEAKVLIDDNPRYAIECAEAGIRVLLFDYENSYPWSKMDSVGRHPLITKVCNWDQVEQQLMRWIGS